MEVKQESLCHEFLLPHIDKDIVLVLYKSVPQKGRTHLAWPVSTAGNNAEERCYGETAVATASNTLC